MKKFKIINWISTGLLTTMMLMSVVLYFTEHSEMVKGFELYGYPSYIIYPLAIAKIFGLLAIWFCKNKVIKEWAYAGFFFNFVLAFLAHFMIGDGEFGGAIVAILLLAASYFTMKKTDSVIA
ncbi:DoxX family protein [Marinifilum caeruleilacunae]|uniref:DoxX family protein n=1 Tax=Marinifilum caeruleilacunae TaxID=2499076 RepID=A0ABX1X0H3_9BACT|nr:DoxX family protein [Marinifilum caeruleilacunae]NOU61772.1 DoxX family protein [Marinifilum caeruleilacunae]